MPYITYRWAWNNWKPSKNWSRTQATQGLNNSSTTDGYICFCWEFVFNSDSRTDRDDSKNDFLASTHSNINLLYTGRLLTIHVRRCHQLSLTNGDPKWLPNNHFTLFHLLGPVKSTATTSRLEGEKREWCSQTIWCTLVAHSVIQSMRGEHEDACNFEHICVIST